MRTSLSLLALAAAAFSLSFATGAARADDDGCQWRVISQQPQSTCFISDGGYCNVSAPYYGATWTVVTEENSCTGAIQTVNTPTQGYCYADASCH